MILARGLFLPGLLNLGDGRCEGVVAQVGRWKMMGADPGIITRSQESCFEMPGQVEECIRAERWEELRKLENVQSEDGERSYCVRCLVWRPRRSHHCRTCGHCVREFDHHCGFYGRCVAGGSHTDGNMLYFHVPFVAGTVATADLCTYIAIAGRMIINRQR